MPNPFESTGLSAAEAARRPVATTNWRRSLPSLLVEVVRESMFLLLLAAGSIYLLLGDIGEAAMLLGFVVIIIMAATAYQDLRRAQPPRSTACLRVQSREDIAVSPPAWGRASSCSTFSER